MLSLGMVNSPLLAAVGCLSFDSDTVIGKVGSRMSNSQVKAPQKPRKVRQPVAIGTNVGAVYRAAAEAKAAKQAAVTAEAFERMAKATRGNVLRAQGEVSLLGQALGLLDPLKGSPLYMKARATVGHSFYAEGPGAARAKALQIVEVFEDSALARRMSGAA